MYLKEFFESVMRKANVSVIIYLIINVLIISWIASGFFVGQLGWNVIVSYIMGALLYVASLAVALSPFGEAILRIQSGCKEIKDPEQRNIIMPIFEEVYKKAKREKHTIADDVNIYISEDEEPNAFATGRKTICLTKGLLALPEDEIKAVLAHEFGHLANKDTDLILVIAVGNFIISGVIMLINAMLFMLQIGSRIFGLHSAADYAYLARVFIVGTFTWVWTKLGVLLVMKSSRENEYEADKFAYDLGYGEELAASLLAISGNTPKRGLFANLVSSHPETPKRVEKLKNYKYSSTGELV